MTVLDTHAFIWAWMEPERLSTAAVEAIARARSAGGLAIASITVWEVAMLIERGRLRVFGTPERWIETAISGLGTSVIEITAAIATISVRLVEPIAKDPADRLIAATAIALGAPLVTADERLRAGLPSLAVW